MWAVDTVMSDMMWVFTGGLSVLLLWPVIWRWQNKKRNEWWKDIPDIRSKDRKGKPS